MGKKGKGKTDVGDSLDIASTPLPKKKTKGGTDEIDAIFSEKSAKPKTGVDSKAPQDKATSQNSKKRKVDEIDSIFQAKRQTHSSDKGASTSGARIEKQENQARVEGNKDDIFGEEAQQARKRTEEGFSIYSEDELGLNRKGGDTDLCPFDCDCCF